MTSLFQSWTPAPPPPSPGSSLFLNLPTSPAASPEPEPAPSSGSSLFAALDRPPPRPSLANYAEHRNPLWDIMDAANVPPASKFALANRLEKASPANPDPIWTPLSDALRLCTQENLAILNIDRVLNVQDLITSLVSQQKKRLNTGLLSALTRNLGPSTSELLKTLNSTISSLDTLHIRTAALLATCSTSVEELALWANILPQLPHHPQTAHWSPHIALQISNFCAPLQSSAATLQLSLQTLQTNQTEALTALRTLRCHFQP